MHNKTINILVAVLLAQMLLQQARLFQALLLLHSLPGNTSTFPVGQLTPMPHEVALLVRHVAHRRAGRTGEISDDVRGVLQPPASLQA